jgi:fumarate reductase (CoM/CoB) subunit A
MGPLPPLMILPGTDVLVVGGGLAALRAALEARRAGATVRMACKGMVGRSGASSVAGQGYSAAFGHGGEPDSPALHTEDTLLAGRGLADPRLVAALCEEAPSRLLELEAWGAAFEKRDGRFVQYRSGGHRAARSCIGKGHRATALMQPLRRTAAGLGVEFVDRLAALSLLMDGGAVCGLLAMDLESGVPAAVPARGVILATGGAGQLYRVTSNPVDLTGDGYAMALDAGAELVDMEFYQFYPWRIVEPLGNRARICVQPWTFARGARLVNRFGNAFMAAYDPERRDAAGRDVVARAIADQLRRGLGIRGGVRVDLSDVSPETFVELNPLPARLLARHGLGPHNCELLVTPEAHFAIGGVRIRPDGATGVPGLFAAGEVAGGVHGADRLGDNALPDAVVFGARAGAAVARHAARGGLLVGPGPIAAAALERLVSGRRPEAHGALAASRMRLAEAMWAGAGVLRNAEGLADALRVARDVYDRAEAMRPTSPRGLVTKVETMHLAAVGEAVARAALLRTESRGAHYREDHPHEDAALARPIRVSRRPGEALSAWVADPVKATEVRAMGWAASSGRESAS